MIGDAIVEARSAHRTLNADGFEVPDRWAYAIQQMVHRGVRGTSPVVGFKLGYTSAVMREAMGVSEPNYGPLTQAMVVSSPARVRSLTQPKVEPEFTVSLGPDLAIETVRASLEVVDSVWSDYRFTWAHNTADGSSAAFAVLGAEIPRDVSLIDVAIEMTSSSGATSGGHVGDCEIDIERSLQWLASRSDLPRGLQPADIVLTGGLARPLDLVDGGWIEATFTSGQWVTRVRVERDEHR